MYFKAKNIYDKESAHYICLHTCLIFKSQ